MKCIRLLPLAARLAGGLELSFFSIGKSLIHFQIPIAFGQWAPSSFRQGASWKASQMRVFLYKTRVLRGSEEYSTGVSNLQFALVKSIHLISFHNSLWLGAWTPEFESQGAKRKAFKMLFSYIKPVFWVSLRDEVTGVSNLHLSLDKSIH